VSDVFYISIGNSDDKLTQAEWSDFVGQTDAAVREYAHVHGAWHSAPDSRWQNACWCVEVSTTFKVGPAERGLRATLARLAGRYRQDSIALALVASTEFIAPQTPEPTEG
jgi:hypothetical protein